MRKKNLSDSTSIEATSDKPVLLCLTCGRATNKIIRRASDTLRGRLKRKYKGKRRSDKPQKRWQRTIKYSEKRKSKHRGKECKAKEIFFSYFMLECLSKKHRLSVRKKPFSTKMASQF